MIGDHNRCDILQALPNTTRNPKGVFFGSHTDPKWAALPVWLLLWEQVDWATRAALLV